MTVWQHFVTIGCVVLGTMCTRFLPFIVFKSDKPTPKYIQYLGKILPGAVFAMLVVYCLKDVSFTSGTHFIPEAICILVVIGLHAWKKNMFLSISVGTVLYMVLVQTVFK